MIGAGAIAHKHAQAYRNIGFTLAACASIHASSAAEFAAQHGCEHVADWRDLCRRDIDYVDVCTFPAFRLQAVELCAEYGKHVQVQKPIALEPATGRRMIGVARRAGILLNVVSQHRFDESAQFLKRAIASGRLGKLIQADAYVKWHRSDAYYARPEKGAWEVEGGGALINQGIHQADLLLWLAGPVRRVSAEWQLAAAHEIQSEDVVSALLRYSSGATGVLQAATAFAPGYPERLEFHGTRGTAIVSGDRLIAWDVEADHGEPPPVSSCAESGAADPMAISLAPFERQFLDFAEAIRAGREPLVSGEEGCRALELVDAIYRSCRQGSPVILDD